MKDMTAKQDIFHLVPYGNEAVGRLSELIVGAKGDDLFQPVTVIAPSQYAGLALRRQLSG